jgi:plasmid maintenance system antidote protein VapI
MSNKHKGSSVRSFFEETGEWEEVEALAQKKVVAETLRRQMEKDKVTKAELARRIQTSRSQVDALLNADDPGLTLMTMVRASFALGLRPDIRFTHARAKGR